MGGVPGYGPVKPEVDEPVFHEEWEGRVFGLVTTVRAGLTRRKLESLDPDEYLAGYYQRWLIAFERGLMDRGVLREDELDAKTEYFRNNPAAIPTRVDDPDQAKRAVERLNRRHRRSEDLVEKPSFAVGDRVRARNIHHRGHTRLPGYVQGKIGAITAVYNPANFPDDVAADELDQVQWLYCVRFESTELWGASTEPDTSLFIDMWEGHLEPIRMPIQDRSNV